MNTDPSLPVDSLKPAFLEALEKSAVVVTAPTGSGKSTQIPRWCGRMGTVLVVEPRRVACRGLAKWVAQLEGTELGDEVGYHVRDDSAKSARTRILFATPGIVLRWLTEGALDEFDTAIIDEFHERGLEVDLLLALLKTRFVGRLAVMSATLNADRVARHLDGVHLKAEGRLFPVSCKHLAAKTMLPDIRGLEERIRDAIAKALALNGDILVFLPGKAEIVNMERRLKGTGDFDVLTVHGSLTLKQQSRVFEPGSMRRVILSTNVAETSITIPGIGVIIDSGLVRRTRYVNGRGFLTLVPIAMDSADQRAGRAGRLGPGVCFRLWSPDAVLEPTTPPEIHREALSPLILAAGACGARTDELPFLDAPKDYAIDSALADLTALGAVDRTGAITDRGRKLYGLPLDASLGNLLVEAEDLGCMEDAMDLVSVLAVGRPVFTGDQNGLDEDDNLRQTGCDAVAFIRAVREGNPERHRLSGYVLKEAKLIRRRLGTAWNTGPKTDAAAAVKRAPLALAALSADPRSAYVARRRKGRVYWGNGGTEIELARESAVDEEKTEAVIVLASMALGQGYRNQKIYATCAMPTTFAQLAQAGFGEERVEHAGREKKTVVARIERIYAGKVIEKREEVPTGNLARDAIKKLFLNGRIFPESLEQSRRHLQSAALFFSLRKSHNVTVDLTAGEWEEAREIPSLERWVEDRLTTIGVTQGDDLSLLSPGDLVAQSLPQETSDWLHREFPPTLQLGNAKYEISYDFSKLEAVFVRVSGTRSDPPSLSTLPSIRGFKIKVKHHSRVWVLRDKG